MDENSWEPMKCYDIDPKIMEIIESFLKEVPNLPVHIHKLLDIVSDSDSDALEVANAASADPGLVSKILRVVNSSYYGLKHKTNNIQLAIVLLGFNEVRKIALQTSFSGTFSEGKGFEGYDTRGLWEHSYMVSVCAESIGRIKETKNTQKAGELLTYGILHDIGKFALFKLALVMKKKGVSPYKSIKELKKSCIMEKEEALFKINHPIVGGMLAKKWDLSDKISAVIEFHHHPSFWDMDLIPPEYLKDATTISVSDSIVNYITGREPYLEPPPDFFEILDLKPPLENCITEEIREKIDEAKRFIGNM